MRFHCVQDRWFVNLMLVSVLLLFGGALSISGEPGPSLGWILISLGCMLACIAACVGAIRELIECRDYDYRKRCYSRQICAICGYDLRATPYRCPECGVPVPLEFQPTRPLPGPKHRPGPEERRTGRAQSELLDCQPSPRS